MTFKYLNGVNTTVGYSGIMANSLGRKQTHRFGQIPECELNFSFVNTKAYTFRASQPAFFAETRAGIE